jgi:ribosomal protein S3
MWLGQQRRVEEKTEQTAQRTDRTVPSVWSAGAKGCILQVSGQVTGCISTVAFSFIVQLPESVVE